MSGVDPGSLMMLMSAAQTANQILRPQPGATYAAGDPAGQARAHGQQMQMAAQQAPPAGGQAGVQPTTGGIDINSLIAMLQQGGRYGGS